MAEAFDLAALFEQPGQSQPEPSAPAEGAAETEVSTSDSQLIDHLLPFERLCIRNQLWQRVGAAAPDARRDGAACASVARLLHLPAESVAAELKACRALLFGRDR